MLSLLKISQIFPPTKKFALHINICLLGNRLPFSQSHLKPQILKWNLEWYEACHLCRKAARTKARTNYTAFFVRSLWWRMPLDEVEVEVDLKTKHYRASRSPWNILYLGPKRAGKSLKGPRSEVNVLLGNVLPYFFYSFVNKNQVAKKMEWELLNRPRMGGLVHFDSACILR